MSASYQRAKSSVLSRRDIPCLPSSVITTNTGKGAGRGGGGPRAGGRVQQTLASPQGGPQTLSRFTSAQGEKGEQNPRATEALSDKGHTPLGARRDPRKAPRTHSSAHFGPLRIPHPKPAAACGFYAARCTKSSGKRLYDSTRETQQMSLSQPKSARSLLRA